jgi:ribosomal protein L11 methyltransferase
MHWNKVSVTVSPEQADAIESLLWALGAVSVTFSDSQDNPIFEPPVGEHPLWQQSEMSALFDQESDLSEITDAIAAECDASVHVEALVERAWEREWLDQFKPMAFGDRLWIVPSAYDSPEDAEVVLRLDPGLAFGTGTHPTTAMILRWLDTMRVDGLSMLDYGCGSGILAVAGLLLGAKTATAVDIDPQAIQATVDNAEQNQVSDRLVTGEVGRVAIGQYDIVLANILAEPLCALAETLCQSTDVGGTLMLSGILQTQRDEVAAAYEGRAIVIDEYEQEGWVAMVLKTC